MIRRHRRWGLEWGDLIVRVDELDLQRAKPANLGAERQAIGN